MAAEISIQSNSPFYGDEPEGLSHLLQELNTAIVCCCSDLLIQYTNPAAQSLFEFSESQAKGESVLHFLNHEGIEKIIGKCLATSQATTLRRTEILSSSHQAKLVDCIISPLKTEGLNYLILEINEINRAVHQSEEDSMEIGQHANIAVIRAIGHEIKNPLGGLRGAAQLLERELGNQTKLKVYTDIIVRETDRLCGLVDSMSHTHTPMQFESINIHEVLEHVRHLTLVEVSDNIRIVQDYDPSLPLVVGDREQLIQAFMNMMLNAVEACASSGLIKLRSRVERQVTLGKERHMSVARIDIEDNGCGIPYDLIDQVFYPMISGNPRGEGLGLSIVHHIITRHGGKVSCESRPGRTVFTTLLKFAGSSRCNS